MAKLQRTFRELWSSFWQRALWKRASLTWSTPACQFLFALSHNKNKNTPWDNSHFRSAIERCAPLKLYQLPILAAPSDSLRTHPYNVRPASINRSSAHPEIIHFNFLIHHLDKPSWYLDKSFSDATCPELRIGSEILHPDDLKPIIRLILGYSVKYSVNNPKFKACTLSKTYQGFSIWRQTNAGSSRSTFASSKR